MLPTSPPMAFADGVSSGGGSHTSSEATCGTEVAHSHFAVDNSGASSTEVKINGKNPSNLKKRAAMSYSMDRYLAGNERHEKVAQGIASPRK